MLKLKVGIVKRKKFKRQLLQGFHMKSSTGFKTFIIKLAPLEPFIISNLKGNIRKTFPIKSNIATKAKKKMVLSFPDSH